MAVLEAMASRCLVLASDLPPLTDIVQDGKTGLISATGDADALALNMERALRARAECSVIQENAHAMACARFSVERMAEQTLDFYISSCGIGLPISR